MIPVEWAAAHRPVAVGTMASATCTIRKPGFEGQAWDEDLEQMVPTPRVPYLTGVPCRAIRLESRGDQAVVGEDPESVADVLVTLPYSVDPLPGDVVVVAGSGCTGDPAWEGVELIVQHSGLSTNAWERDLYCTFLT